MTLPSKHPRRRTGPSAKTVKMVRERDGWRCVRCGSPRDLTTHHRKPRGSGGTTDPARNSPANLISLCGSGTTGCHGWVEHHATEAHLYGWRLWYHDDPTIVPVQSSTYGLIRLAGDGSFEYLDAGIPA